MQMKILFFSDVHGSPESLKQLWKQQESREPDQLVLLGDALYHGPRNPLRPDYAPPEVVPMLNAEKERIIAVRGNCDSEVDQMLLEFPIMADFSTLYVDGIKFFLTHGHRWNPGAPPPVSIGTVLTYGHTHLPQLERLENGLIAFNPGSISLPKGGNPASFGWYEDGTLRVLELESGREMAALTLEKV